MDWNYCLDLCIAAISAQISFSPWGGSMSAFERLLEPGCTEGAAWPVRRRGGNRVSAGKMTMRASGCEGRN